MRFLKKRFENFWISLEAKNLFLRPLFCRFSPNDFELILFSERPAHLAILSGPLKIIVSENSWHTDKRTNRKFLRTRRAYGKAYKTGRDLDGTTYMKRVKKRQRRRRNKLIRHRFQRGPFGVPVVWLLHRGSRSAVEKQRTVTARTIFHFLNKTCRKIFSAKRAQFFSMRRPCQITFTIYWYLFDCKGGVSNTWRCSNIGLDHFRFEDGVPGTGVDREDVVINCWRGAWSIPSSSFVRKTLGYHKVRHIACGFALALSPHALRNNSKKHE